MSEKEEFNLSEEEFINYLRQRKGLCPEEEVLVAYSEGGLSADKANEVADHVQICLGCQDTLRILDLEKSEDLPEPPDWPEIEKRTRSRFMAYLISWPWRSSILPTAGCY